MEIRLPEREPLSLGLQAKLIECFCLSSPLTVFQNRPRAPSESELKLYLRVYAPRIRKMLNSTNLFER